MIMDWFGERDEIAAVLCNYGAIVRNRIGEHGLIGGAGTEYADIDHTLNVVAGFA